MASRRWDGIWGVGRGAGPPTLLRGGLGRSTLSTTGGAPRLRSPRARVIFSAGGVTSVVTMTITTTAANTGGTITGTP